MTNYILIELKQRKTKQYNDPTCIDCKIEGPLLPIYQLFLKMNGFVKDIGMRVWPNIAFMEQCFRSTGNEMLLAL